MKWIQEIFLYVMIPAAVLVTAAALCAAARRRRALTQLLGKEGGSAAFAVHLSRSRRALKWICAGLALLLLLLAAARPYWNTETVQTRSRSRGRDVVVLFDVSKSMYAADPAPSRLAHAKQLLREIVQHSPGDRFAIIAFAGSAYTLSPLTADRGATMEYVDDLTPALAPYGGTNLERAFREMEKAFFAAEGMQRTVLLLTDGEELSGNSRRFIDGLKSKKIPLIVVGLGDPVAGAPIPGEGGALVRDSEGRVVTSRLNEKLLRELAEKSGGSFVHSTALHPGVEEIEALMRKGPQKEHEEAFSKSRPVERFPLFLGGAAFFLAAALALSEYAGPRRRKTLLLFFGLMPLLLCAAGVPQKDPMLRYNEARRSQQKGGEAEAVALYESVIEDAGQQPQLRARSFYNLGIGRHKAGQTAFDSAQKLLSGGKTDEALKMLEQGREALELAETFYGRALSSGAAPGKNVREPLLQLHADRKRNEALKKEIEELKKLQEEARQETRKAQQQNNLQNRQQSQAQNQQNQPQNQPQNQQSKAQNQQQKQQQNQQQDSARQAVEKARQSAEKLQQKAQSLKQQRLADDARDAEKELKQAGEKLDAQKRKEAQRHLENAARILGDTPSPKAAPKKEEPSKQPDRPSPAASKKEEPSKQPDRPSSAAPDQERDGKKEEKEKAAAAQLQSLNEEARSLRGEIRRGRENNQPKVERDW